MSSEFFPFLIEVKVTWSGYSQHEVSMLRVDRAVPGNLDHDGVEVILGHGVVIVDHRHVE
jgi:hypothetical protein